MRPGKTLVFWEKHGTNFLAEMRLVLCRLKKGGKHLCKDGRHLIE